MKSLEFRIAHEFCSELYKMDKRSNGNGLLHLEEMLQDYSSNTTVKAVLEDLSNRMIDIKEEVMI